MIDLFPVPVVAVATIVCLPGLHHASNAASIDSIVHADAELA